MRSPDNVAAIRRRLAEGYPARSLRLSLAAAKADVATLLGELEWAAQACDGFTEMIGRGLLRPNTTPSGRRRILEHAAEAKARRDALNPAGSR